MNPELHRAAIERLMADYAFKKSSKWLTDGICPQCGDKTVYAPEDAPWMLRCNRLNHCSYEEHLKDRYPDLFDDWSQRHAKTPQNPHAAADAYLRDARGFDISKLAGWYTQEDFWKADINEGSATVRFSLGHDVWWERIIDRPWRFGKQKANFRGSYGGMWWTPPEGNLARAAQIWLVEGIFDAISLWSHGYAAVSLMSSNNYPELALKGLAAQCDGNGRPQLIFALDGDKAGRDATNKWIKRARAEGWPCGAAQIRQPQGKKLDWNDLHLRGRITAEEIEECLYLGDLLIAPTPLDRAVLIHRRKHWPSFSLDHGNRLYWFKIDDAKLKKAREQMNEEGIVVIDEKEEREAAKRAAEMDEISTCLPIPLYSQRNDFTDERWYYFRVALPQGSDVKNTFTAGQLTSVAEFKKRLLSVAVGGIYTGTQSQLDRLNKLWLQGLPTVHSIDFQGYSREHQAYIYSHLAIKNGKVYKLNQEDFFELPKLAIKTLNKSLVMEINDNSREFRLDWLDTLWTCFSSKGIAALAWWLGCLFAEQIRAIHKSYPFMEIVGEAGAGKSTLIEFLWKLCGRSDYEGVDPLKGSHSGRMRSYSQVANLPIVLIESDRENKDSPQGRPSKNFDFSELKDAYNGRTIRITGVKNGGNETVENPFRAAFCISQNNPVEGPEAILQRINHIYLDCKSHTQHTKTAASKLETFPTRELSGFLLEAVRKEKDILAKFSENTPKYEAVLRDAGARNFRIAKNHAQHKALLDALAMVIPLSEEVIEQSHACITKMALERQQAISADHPIVQQFWDIYDYIEDTSDCSILNHSSKPGLIAVNLIHFLEVSASRKQNPPTLADLKRFLKTSRKRRFLDVKLVRSAFNTNNRTEESGYATASAVLSCWIFQTYQSRGGQ